MEIALNQALLRVPEGFTCNPRLERLRRRRRGVPAPLRMARPADWGHAEALAFATILAEGTPIRLTGQDTERGTFSQRHAVLHDHETGAPYVPCSACPRPRLVRGLEQPALGERLRSASSTATASRRPDALVLWEAQYGDFVNGAQVIVDQFIVLGARQVGAAPSLVLLLPHGYEGQGPEHSSARLERFLQTGRRGQHPRRQLHHRRAVLPPPAAPGVPAAAGPAARWW